MIYDYTIEYNGCTSQSFGIEVVRRPDIPAPLMRRETITIPGRDGALYIRDQEIEDIELEIEFNFMEPAESWTHRNRTARKWLFGDGDRRLVLGDDRDYFYIVKQVDMEMTERLDWEIGRFVATFICEGYQYLKDGARQYTVKEVLYNPYNISKPTYFITGEGICNLTVNGKQMSANVGQNLTVDTGLMMAYREDGAIMNTAVSGEYKDLYLLEGNNEITITQGFQLSVIPNWRSI